MIGIYCIKNETDGMVYVGKTKNITSRWHDHMSRLRAGTHHAPRLQQAYNETDITNFTFKVLEVCTMKDLDEKEGYWINKLRALNPNFGYNEAETTYAKKPILTGDDELEYRIKGEKFILNVDNFLALDLTSREKIELLNIFTKITAEGVIKKNHKEFMTMQELRESTKLKETANKQFFKKIKDCLVNKKTKVYIKEKYCKKTYEYKMCKDSCVYIYKNTIEYLYSNFGESKSLNNLFSFIKHVNRYHNYICKNDFINDTSIILNNKLGGIGNSYSKDPGRFFKTVEEFDINGEKIIIFNNDERNYYINPRLFHYSKMLINLQDVLNRFKSN